MQNARAAWVLDGAAWLMILFLFGYLASMAFAAFIFPMELEVREGLLWLYVLAYKSGVSVYDHSQVAYYGTHGPILHVLQAWSGVLFPFFEANHMIRVFVLLAPFSCLWLFIFGSGLPGRNWWLPAGFAACAYAGMVNLSIYNLLVGRSDSLAIVLVALQMGFAIRFMLREKASKFEICLFNLFGVTLIFSIWRFLPYAIVVWIVGTLSITGYNLKKIFKCILIFGGLFATLFTACMITQFNGDLSLFYQHMYGFYFDPKLAVVAAGKEFEFVPEALRTHLSRAGATYLPMIAATLVAAFMRQRVCRHWLVVLIILWLAYVAQVYGYYKNMAGFNGPYYFSAQVLVSWAVLFGFLAKGNMLIRRVPVFAALSLYLALVPDWAQMHAQLTNMINHRKEARNFRNVLAELYDKGELMSEDLQFFKNSLGASKVDNGDGVENLLIKGYFGRRFDETARSFFNRVRSGMYPYFIYAGVASGGTTEYLKANYDVVMRGPAYDTMNGPGGCKIAINCILLLKRR